MRISNFVMISYLALLVSFPLMSVRADDTTTPSAAPAKSDKDKADSSKPVDKSDKTEHDKAVKPASNEKADGKDGAEKSEKAIKPAVAETKSATLGKTPTGDPNEYWIVKLPSINVAAGKATFCIGNDESVFCPDSSTSFPDQVDNGKNGANFMSKPVARIDPKCDIGVTVTGIFFIRANFAKTFFEGRGSSTSGMFVNSNLTGWNQRQFDELVRVDDHGTIVASSNPSWGSK